VRASVFIALFCLPGVTGLLQPRELHSIGATDTASIFLAAGASCATVFVRAWSQRGEAPPNRALKLTNPTKERAPRHSAVQHGAPCSVARSSLMWASQPNAGCGRRRP
jgi:hypothetical protein